MIRTSFRRAALTAVACLAVVASVTIAADAPKSSTVTTGLDNPSGIVVHPGGDLFVASHAGVHRLSGGKLHPEVGEFKTDIYGKGPMYNISPLGVALLGDDHLIVGDGSLKDAEELVRIYKIGPKALEKPVSADSAAVKLGPIGASPESAKGEGNFYGIAVSKSAIYVTSNGDDTKGWILRSELKDGKPGELKPFIATKPLVNVDAPVAITLNHEGQIVVGQMGEMNVVGDSLLCTYDTNGKLVSSLKTGLSDIAGLAYSPKTKSLYAVDYSWAAPKEGGLFKLEIAEGAVKATKVASLDKPTALAFDKMGNLYVTVFGTVVDGGKPTGSIVKFDAGL